MNPGKLEAGYGVQVVSPTPEHTFTLDEGALSELLLREDVRERSVVVVSVAGAFRKGKSFLLDFFLRYMHHKYNIGGGDDDWMGSETEPLRGFSWRGGSERNTSGLLLWSQPFKTTLENGEKVVIFLVDTQGTFDSQSTVKDNATIFALSTMISSVQIYNLSQNIEEDDLQHLELFTEYGRLAKKGSGDKPFQKLEFLVRDWSFPYDYEYGSEGGNKLLQKRLEISEGQHPQLESLRRHIKSCFEELGCFLMPHPGLRVATDPKFTGSIADIDPQFRESLKQLVPMVLAPQNLVPKLIKGQMVRAKDLLHYFKAYINVFNGSELPEPKTILEATAEANNLSAVAEARDVYGLLMEEVAGGTKPYLATRLLEEEHKRARDKALHAFHTKRKMGGDDFAKIYEEQLVKEMEEEFEQIRGHNESKALFRLAGIPAVFVAFTLLGYLLSVFAGLLNIQILVMAGQIIAITAVICLSVWGYARWTGNMHQVGETLEEFARKCQDYVFMSAWGEVKYQITTTSYHKEKKQ